MRHAADVLKRFVLETDGTTAVEYAVMLAMILAVVIGTIHSLGQDQAAGWNAIRTELETH